MKLRGNIRIVIILLFVLSVCFFSSPRTCHSASLLPDVQQLPGITMDKSVLWGPGRLATGADGTLYVVDSYRNHIVKFHRNGDYLGDIAFPRPSAVAVAADGTLYIGSNIEHSVAIYRNGKIAGYLGSGASEFSSVRDIAVDRATGRVYVADSLGNAVRIFSSTGMDLGSIAGVNTPISIEVTPDKIYVLDEPTVLERQSRTTAARISIFDKALTLVKTIDDYGKYDLFRPTDIAVADGMLYVSDAALQSIVLFDSGGTCLGEIQSIQGPIKTAVSLAMSGGILYVSASETHSIMMYSITPPVSGIQGGQK